MTLTTLQPLDVQVRDRALERPHQELRSTPERRGDRDVPRRGTRAEGQEDEQDETSRCIALGAGPPLLRVRGRWRFTKEAIESCGTSVQRDRPHCSNIGAAARVTARHNAASHADCVSHSPSEASARPPIASGCERFAQQPPAQQRHDAWHQ